MEDEISLRVWVSLSVNLIGINQTGTEYFTLRIQNDEIGDGTVTYFYILSITMPNRTHSQPYIKKSCVKCWTQNRKQCNIDLSLMDICGPTVLIFFSLSELSIAAFDKLLCWLALGNFLRLFCSLSSLNHVLYSKPQTKSHCLATTLASRESMNVNANFGDLQLYQGFSVRVYKENLVPSNTKFC